MLALLLALSTTAHAGTPDLRPVVRAVLEQPTDADRLAWLKQAYEQARADHDKDMALAVFRFRLVLEPAMRFGELPADQLRGWLRVAVSPDEALFDRATQAAFLGALPSEHAQSPFAFPDGRPDDRAFRQWQDRRAVVRLCTIESSTLVTTQTKNHVTGDTTQGIKHVDLPDSHTLVPTIGARLVAARPFLEQVERGGAPDMAGLKVTPVRMAGVALYDERELEDAIRAWNTALAAELTLDEAHLRVLPDVYPPPNARCDLHSTP